MDLKIRVDLYIHKFGENENEVLVKLNQILGEMNKIMADVATVKGLVTALNDETNVVASKIDALNARIAELIAAGTVSATDLQEIQDGLTATSARLKTLGEDPANPIPPSV